MKCEFIVLSEVVPIMLCTYENVQRVRNGWKVNLKDGVMAIDHKDWVFHSANAEFEW